MSRKSPVNAGKDGEFPQGDGKLCGNGSGKVGVLLFK